MFVEVKRNQGNQKQTGGSIIKDVRNRFRLKQENEEVNERIIRDIKNLFELEDYYKQVTVDHFHSNNISTLKVTVIELKYYQSNNSLKKLDHT